jgi:hypothetical protein
MIVRECDHGLAMTRSVSEQEPARLAEQRARRPGYDLLTDRGPIVKVTTCKIGENRAGA